MILAVGGMFNTCQFYKDGRVQLAMIGLLGFELTRELIFITLQNLDIFCAKMRFQSNFNVI